MAQGVVARKEHNRSRTKVKTGCGTCRIRKVKCDEGKPFCKRCVSTGRTCEGYQSPYRFCNSSNKNDTHMAAVNPGIGLQPIAPPLAEITPEEIDLLNRYFSTKTICNVNLHCDQEARQLLHASLTDSSIRHAVSSLRALREDLEVSRDSSAPVMRQTPSYNYGLEQYSMALAGLASTLSSPGSNGLKSTLLCCQIFVSIEEVQGNFDAMAQHVIQGLRIVREYRVRPSLTVGNTLVPAHHDQLPLLDVFIIKLFAAPCKFAEPPPTADVTGTTSSGCSVSPRQPVVESRDLRTISPDIRTVLTRIASSTLQFLSKVSQVASVESAIQLLPEKAALVDSLRSWLVGLQAIQTENSSADNALISVSFVRMFHLVLKIVLLGALESSPDLDIELQTEADRLQAIAKSVGERLKAYRMFSDG